MKYRIVLATAVFLLLSGCVERKVDIPPRIVRGNSEAEALRERKGVVRLHGRPATLLGPELKTGDKAPDFRVVDRNFMKTGLKDFSKKVLVIFSVPSLETEVCRAETARFNEEAAKLPDGVEVIAVSNDLPFTQSKFCGTIGDLKVEILSDAVWRDFGKKYGVLIKDMGLLARAVFVVNRKGVITYIEIVPEISKQPDYEAALNAAKTAEALK